MGEWVVVYDRGAQLPGGEPGVFPGLRIAVARDDAQRDRMSALAPVTECVPLVAELPDTIATTAALDLAAQLVRMQQRLDVPEGMQIGGWRGDDEVPPTEAALFGVVNLSFEPPRVLHPVTAGDVIQHATLALSEDCMITAAAGNRGRLDGAETLSAWSQVPWVIGVGATTDAAGTTLWQRSSRGDPAVAGSGPTCVAWGASGLSPQLVATSFASARMASLCTSVIAAILQLRGAARNALGHREGVRLVGRIIVDEFGDEPWWPLAPRLDVSGLPPMRMTDAAADVWHELGRVEPDLELRGRPEQVKALVVASARPVPGCDVHDVGAGFVSIDSLADLLARLTATQWLAVMGRADLASVLPPSLAAQSLMTTDAALELFDIVEATAPVAMIDRRTCELRLRDAAAPDAAAPDAAVPGAAVPGAAGAASTPPTA